VTEPPDFYSELIAAGFSRRTAGALQGSAIGSIEELRTRPWGHRNSPQTLAWELSKTPKLADKSIAEVEAFRASGDPQSARPTWTTYINVGLSPDQLLALDTFIAKQSGSVSRPEAIRALMAEVVSNGAPTSGELLAALCRLSALAQESSDKNADEDHYQSQDLHDAIADADRVAVAAGLPSIGGN
jgi:hypothetical protein